MQTNHVAPMPERALIVRLAETDADLNAVQSLRWRVFCEERGAVTPSSGGGLDADAFDRVCDHLLVEDIASGTPETVGTYRLLRHSVASAHDGFYSASEFDLAPLLHSSSDSGSELLELGRSCVLPPIAIRERSSCFGAASPPI